MLHIIQRLFTKREDFKKAINFDFTSYGTNSVVMFISVDSDKNLTVLKRCLKLYKYSSEEIEQALKQLETTLQSRLDEHFRQASLKIYKSQGGLGNWAGVNNSYEVMIKTLIQQK